MVPPTGDGAELQFAFPPFHAPELAGLNLVFQIFASFILSPVSFLVG